MIAFIQDIISKIILSIGKIEWAPRNLLTNHEQDIIRNLLINNYYIILSRRNNALSTYFVMIGNFFITGKLGYWDHALMNAEDTVIEDNFEFIQATNIGVQYSTFADIFNVNGVALLKPKNMLIEDWTVILDKLKSEIGKPYDSLFELANDNAFSCVDLVRTALMAEPTYLENFGNFERLIQKHGKLTPEMFYNCPDFEIVYEVRR